MFKWRLNRERGRWSLWRLCQGFVFFGGLVSGFVIAHGQQQEAQEAATSRHQVQDKGWSFQKVLDHSNLSLGLGFSSYFQRTEISQRQETVSEALDLTLSWNYQWHGVLDGAIDLTNRYCFQGKDNYLMVKDFYTGLNAKKWDLWVGRKWYKWSEADEHLSRGLYQGRFMNNKLRKDSHGLTGAFVENKWLGGSWVVFASPLYVPEFGPSYELTDGRFYSPSPYFAFPVNRVGLLGVNSIFLRYSIAKVSEREIILNGSFATRFEHSWKNWFLRGSYAYKPMNQLLYAAEFSLQHKEEGLQDIHVKVYPRVQYHHLSTIEAGWKERGGWNSWLSWIDERPQEEKKVPYEWVSQTTGRTGIVTASVGYDLFAGTKDVTRLYTSYSRVEGGDGPDSGEFKAQETFFERRYQFWETIELGLKGGHLLLGGQNFTWGARGLYDFVQQGGALLADARWSWGPQWEVWGTVDVMEIVNPEQAQFSRGFLGRYQANDRVQVGMNYVF